MKLASGLLLLGAVGLASAATLRASAPGTAVHRSTPGFNATAASNSTHGINVASGPAVHTPQGWLRADRTPHDTILNFTVAMPLSNTSILNDLFWNVSTPGHEMYGKFWSLDKLNNLTATAPGIYKNVTTWLSKFARCANLTTNSLKCSAKSRDVETALNGTLFAYKHVQAGVLAHRLEGNYSLPNHMIGQIDFISGLTMLPMNNSMHASLRRTQATSSSSDASSLVVIPSTLQNMYQLGQASAQGMTQSAVEFENADSYSRSDLRTFQANVGAPAYTVTRNIGHFNPNNPQLESSLDVQYLGAIGAGATNYYYTSAGWLYEMTQDMIANSAYGIDVLSMSVGWYEQQQCQISPGAAPCQSGGAKAFLNAVNLDFQKLGAAGISIMASSGDAGAHGRSDLGCSSPRVRPAFPASSPYVTAVGATQLMAGALEGGSGPICQSLFSCAGRGEEMVCSTATGAAITSGGGFSDVFSRPSYQDSAVHGFLTQIGVAPSPRYFNAGGRGYPDVSALGHQYYIEAAGETQIVDGTSASCPVFAGVISSLNSALLSSGGSKLGFANPTLYAAWAHDAGAFSDVTQGSNVCTQSGSRCCSTGFKATAGWDPVTGMGTPNYPRLLSAIQAVQALRKQ